MILLPSQFHNSTPGQCDFDFLSKSTNGARKFELVSELQEVVKYLNAVTNDRKKPLDWGNTVGKEHLLTIYQLARKYLNHPCH